MKVSLPVFAAALMLSTSAIAQTTPADPANPSTTAPAEKITPPITPEATTPSQSDSTAMPSTTASETAASSAGPMLSDDEAKEWIDKVIYSSDDKNIGEVSAIERDASGHVKEIHADIGGFLGLGETRVRLTPDQFKLAGDRVVLTVTSDSAKTLPKVEG